MDTEKENKKSTNWEFIFLLAASALLYEALFSVAMLPHYHSDRETAYIFIRLVSPFLQLTGAIFFIKKYFKS